MPGWHIPHSECREQVPDSECQSQAGLERGRLGSEGLKAANHIQLTQDRSQIMHREGNFPPQPFTQLSDSGSSWWKPQGK